MKVHSLIQGSPEWVAYRATMRNASDAPAMMGCSIYKTRAELLREMHTGLAADVDVGTQKRFDNGHRVEALARPLAEEFIGAELYPVTGSLGNLSASFDGITLDESTCFEHKALNDSLRAAFAVIAALGPADDAAPGRTLPLMYRVQMEQQLLVSGAERGLFMASAWTSDEELIEEQHCWYYPDAALRQQIVEGWAQFDRDLAAYTLPPSVEPVQAEHMESLPAVSVRLDGALSVAGNLPSFAEALRAFIGRMPKKPTTDVEFATCEAACKALRKAEDALDAAEAGALASITDVEAMRRAVADCRKLARDTRIAAEKMVERRKTEIKESAVMNARRALDLHVSAVNSEIAPMQIIPPAADLAGAIKGKRSIDSMQNALDATLAAAKIVADAQGRAIRANVTVFKAATGENRVLQALFADLEALVHKPADDFAVLVGSRVKAYHEAEAEKERKRQAEQAEQAAAALAAAAAPPRAPMLAQDECPPLSITLAAEPKSPMHASEAAISASADPATVNLGALADMLGFPLRADFISTALGIQPTGRDRSAVLYQQRQVPLIVAAMQRHLARVLAGLSVAA